MNRPADDPIPSVTSTHPGPSLFRDLPMSIRIPRRLLLLLALLTPAAPTLAEPSAAEARTVLLLTRALGYDRMLRRRAGDVVVVGVLEDARHPEQAARSRELREYLASRDGLTVRGLPLDCVPVPVDPSRPLSAALSRLEVDVLLLVAPPDDWDLPAIFETTSASGILTMSTDPQVVRDGASLGAAAEGSRIRLIVNLSASRREGASFSTDLLQLAEVIR